MPTLETALVYPGACLIEGTNLSEGRGTTTPFQVVGAPFLDGPTLARDLADLGTPGCLIRPVRFRPTFDKHQGAICSGVMIHVTNPQLFRPVATYLSLITLARRQAPENFEFLTRVYEFEKDKPAFDLLCGSSRVREAILADAHLEEVVSSLAPPPHDWAETVLAAEARVQEMQL